MQLVNSFTSWQPLEEVIVGRVYSPKYFDFISDPQVRNQLQQILHESEEDLDNLSRTIESYGAIVRRPDLPDVKAFQNNQIKNNVVPLPPLTPRDWQITLGNKLLRILPMWNLDRVCERYKEYVIQPERYDPNFILNGASASCIVRVGRDIFF